MLKDINLNERKDTRSGFGAGIYEAAKKNDDIVVLTADLAGSLKLNPFIQDFPNRFFECGIAEANMVGVAAGLTIGGKIPVATTFANFLTGRVYDQIRQSVAYSNKNVKLCASHAGLTLGEDGATHQILEDIGLMRMLPNMTVICPCDYNQTKNATLAIMDLEGPVYLRFGRPKVPNFTEANQKFEIGKAQLIQVGEDVTIFATGHLVWKAIEAGIALMERGIRAEIINIHTIKPLDEKSIISSAMKTKCVVTAEEHEQNGGLGDAVSNVLVRNFPVPVEMVAVKDTFGESGKPEELMAKYGIDTPNIIEAAIRAINRVN
jgi:transketolase